MLTEGFHKEKSGKVAENFKYIFHFFPVLPASM